MKKYGGGTASKLAGGAGHKIGGGKKGGKPKLATDSLKGGSEGAFIHGSHAQAIGGDSLAHPSHHENNAAHGMGDGMASGEGSHFDGDEPDSHLGDNTCNY